MLTALAVAFVWTLVTGPAFDDWRARRRAARDRPDARVVFLLPSQIDPAPALAGCRIHATLTG